MSTKKNKMNKTQDVNPMDLNNQITLSPDEQAIMDLHRFSQAVDHHELKEELWEQLFYTLTAEHSLMTANQRAAHMMNYKLLLTTSKAIRQLFPGFQKVKVERLKDKG